MTSSAHRHGAEILPILAAIKLSQSCELLPLINSCCRIYDSLEAPSKARVSRYYHHSFYSVILKSIWYKSISGQNTDDLNAKPATRAGFSSVCFQRFYLLYCSSVTCSIQSTGEPLSFSCMAMWLMAVVALAPCQCFSPGKKYTISPW